MYKRIYLSLFFLFFFFTAVYAEVTVSQNPASSVSVSQLQPTNELTTNPYNDDAVSIHEEKAFYKDFIKKIHPVMSFRGGLDIAHVGEDSNVLLYPTLVKPNTYQIDNSWQNQGVWGVLLGLDIPLKTPEYRWQVGISFYQTLFDMEGTELEYMDPEANNLGFKYTIQNRRVLFESKLLRKITDNYSGYLLIGFGANLNQSHSFQEYSLESTSLPDPFFKDKTVNSFSYAFGIGLEFDLIRSLSLSLGYQFSDLGQTALDTFTGQTTNDHIQSFTTYTQEIILALTYVI